MSVLFTIANRIPQRCFGEWVDGEQGNESLDDMKNCRNSTSRA